MSILILWSMIAKSSYTAGTQMVLLPTWVGSVELQGGVRLDTGKAWLRKCRQKGWMSVLGAFRQREMAIGHVSQGRASFASEEYGSSEGRTG